MKLVTNAKRRSPVDSAADWIGVADSTQRAEHAQPVKNAESGERAHIKMDWTGRSLFLITSTDGGVIFDLDNDEFQKLDPIAAEMWKLLVAGNAKAEVANGIAQRYGVEAARVFQDLQNLMEWLANRGITPELTRCSQPATAHGRRNIQATFPWYGHDPDGSRPRAGLGTVFRAFLALGVFDLALSARSLKSLCKHVSNRPVNPRAGGGINVIGKVCTAVERACVWYPKKAVCLQRSAVTTCLLRSRGVPARMVVAARVMPLLFHAWVEVNGDVVNDHERVTSVYETLASF